MDKVAGQGAGDESGRLYLGVVQVQRRGRMCAKVQRPDKVPQSGRVSKMQGKKDGNTGQWIMGKIRKAHAMQAKGK
jgi:hypothetical protein